MCVARTPRLFWLVALLALLVPAGARAAGPRGEKYALLVGVKKYNAGGGLRSLHYTESDMIDLAKVLQANGYRPENIILMTQATAARQGERFLPQAARVRKELRQLLKDRSPADTVVVGFSGHGIQLKTTDEFYFCPQDTDLSDSRSLVSLTDVYKELERCPARFKILMADACRTDPFKGSSSKAVIPVDSVTRPQTRPLPGGVAAFFACSKGQEAYEDDDLKNGVFFHYVIEGLNGAAASPGTKEVTLPGLQDYVTRRVSAYVRRKYGKEQLPELRNQTRGLVALVGGEEPAAPAAAPRQEVQTVALRRTQAEPAAAPGPSTEVRNLLVRAQALADRGEPAKALPFYEQALKLDPGSAEAYAFRASARNDQGAYDQALADCERALKLDSRLAAAHEFRADAYIGKRDYERAFQACAQALEIDPKRAGVYNDRGVIYTLQGKTDKAVAEFTRALELDPQNARAFGNRASAYFETKDYARAVSDYTAALKLGPSDPSAYYYRSLSHQQLGHADQARDDRAVALKLGFTPPKQ
jgi:tetratricopeptide (TPR) repeat protein